MAKIELSLHKNYVPTWSIWEGIREIMQNAMDENDKGHKISVVHSAKKEILTIGNEDSELTIPNLLIGYTTKAGDKEARGEKGEGLDLGLLALTRAGVTVEVRTPTETWVPVIEFSQKWGEEILYIKTRAVQKRREGTYISIKGITLEMWAQIENRFLDFQSYKEEDRISVSYYGDLLLEHKYKSKIYVKGIYVQTDKDLKFGYNLNTVGLDRDRRMVASHDLDWSLSKIISGAVSQRPEKMKAIVWEMINNEVRDVMGFSKYNSDESIKKAMAEMFTKEHGEDAVPVDSIGQSEEMVSVGKRGVVAPRVLRDIVDGEVDSVEKVREKLALSTTKTHSWDDLTEVEAGVLTKAAKTIDFALNLFRGNKNLCFAMESTELYSCPDDRVLDMIQIVDFRKDTIRGMCDTKSGEIQIARVCLGNYHITLRTLIHELAHRFSKSGDARVQHAYTTESIWLAVDFARTDTE